MSTLFLIDKIIDSPSKIGILRVLSSAMGFKGTGSEIARLAGFSVPATHETLKSLNRINILNLEIVGKQHIYSLNEKDRFVRKLIRPMFQVETGLKVEIGQFIHDMMVEKKIQKKVTALILYGSLQKGNATSHSDVDIAVIVEKEGDLEQIVDIFTTDIAIAFKYYFGVHLDPYVKTVAEFRER